MLREYECKRCGHRWVPNKPNPTVCPKCKSYFWNKPKKVKEKSGGKPI
jgi:predicted Zn-ribbon and HTH transcriptional regulator